MKTIVGLVIFGILTASCMREACATYGDKKRHTSNVAKADSRKDRTPYYKTIRMAERD